LNGETIDAIGIFKSETKDKFLKIYTTSKGFGIEENEGVIINKIDKGCLIFNTEKDNGYLVAIVDKTNKGSEAKYWTDDFLHVKPRKDSFNQTQNMLSLCKSFVSQLPSDNGKVEKATYMNRSVEALKEESVNVNAFAENVFKDPGLVSEFKQYKDAYQKERDIEIDDTFETASTAIKRRTTGTMTTIKLDKNFDINIHGGEQYIERGYDEERGMYYYKMFFKEEK
jgi:hypothetical protein